MTHNQALTQLMREIGSGRRDVALQMLAATPELATAALAKGQGTSSAELFLDACKVQVYVGHTALHVAATVYDVDIARALVASGADVRARNRRGSEPLHSATHGNPADPLWDPAAQAAMIAYLLDVGADLEAAAEGGVTPLQRAVRNRCSAAVRVLLEAGADPHRTNKNGSTAFTLAQWTTGRGGTGSADAKREQATISQLLEQARS